MRVEPRFQLSLDVPELERAIRLAELGAEAGIHVLEAGTGLLLTEGAGRVLPRIRARFPAHPLVADIKCTDGGAFEAGGMFDLGATAVTVMASASDATIRLAVREAESRRGCAVMVDTMGMGGPGGHHAQGHVDAARRARDLGAHCAVIHLGFDERTDNPKMVEQNLLLRWAEAAAAADIGIPLQVVGGLTLAQAALLPSLGISDIVISMNLGSVPAGELRYEEVTGFLVDLESPAACDAVRGRLGRFIQEVTVAASEGRAL